MTLIELRQLRNEKIADSTKWLVALITKNPSVDPVHARKQIGLNNIVILDCEQKLLEFGVRW